MAHKRTEEGSMEMKQRIWMAVLVLAGPLIAFGGVGSETGTVAEQIVQDAEDSVKRIKTLIKDAQRGDSESQFDLGKMIRDKAPEYWRYTRTPVDESPATLKAHAKGMMEARSWFARAAEQGHLGAQMELSRIYRRKYPPGYSFMTDYILSYAWLKVAMDKGAREYTNGQSMDKRLREKMTAEQVAEAEKLAGEFRVRIETSQSK